MNWLQRLLARFFGTPRPTPTRPTQSSFHLVWRVPPGAPIHAVEATLSVDADPVVDEVYFWAMQASFSDATGSYGGAHTGLQWNPRFPAARAVNWGGYHDGRFGGAVLDGTSSPLPSTPQDRNTRDYAWSPGSRYRFRIEPASTPGRWLASVTDVASGITTEIRELECGGDRLTAPVVWSEVFAPCEAPSVSVRWEDLVVERRDGGREQITTVETRYQARADGGCANTDSHVEGAAFVQTTNTDRITPAGRSLSI